MKRLIEQAELPAKRQLVDLSVYAELWLVILPRVFPERHGFPLDDLGLGASIRLVCKRWDDLVKRAFVDRKLAVLKLVESSLPSVRASYTMGDIRADILRRKVARWKIGICSGDGPACWNAFDNLMRPIDTDTTLFLLTQLLDAPSNQPFDRDSTWSFVIKAMLAGRADERFSRLLPRIPYDLICKELAALHGAIRLALRSDNLLGWFRLLSSSFSSFGTETPLLGKFSAVSSFGRRPRLFLDIVELFPDKVGMIQRILEHRLGVLQSFSQLVMELFNFAPELVGSVDWRYVAGAHRGYAGLMCRLFRYIPQGMACVLYNANYFLMLDPVAFNCSKLSCEQLIDYLSVSLEKVGSDLPLEERLRSTSLLEEFKARVQTLSPDDDVLLTQADYWRIWSRRDLLDPEIVSALLMN